MSSYNRCISLIFRTGRASVWESSWKPTFDYPTLIQLRTSASCFRQLVFLLQIIDCYAMRLLCSQTVTMRDRSAWLTTWRAGWKQERTSLSQNISPGRPACHLKKSEPTWGSLPKPAPGSPSRNTATQTAPPGWSLPPRYNLVTPLFWTPSFSEKEPWVTLSEISLICSHFHDTSIWTHSKTSEF